MSEGSQRRRVVWVVVGIGVAVVVLLAVLAGPWLSFRGSGPAQPVRYVRDASGRMEASPGPDGPSGIQLEAHAGKIEARNTCSSSQAKSHSGNSRFACRTLAVFNLSDHPLMASVGPAVAEKLAALPYVDRIDYYPVGHRPKPGEAAPDLVLTLDAGSIEEKGWLRRGLEAEIHFGVGRHFANSRNFYHDHTTPPRVEFTCRGRLDHQSTTSGATPRYQLAAANIAEAITQRLADQFDECLKAYGPLPELPGDFYPAYRPAPDLPFLKKRQAELLTAHHGLMTRNDSLWRISAEGDPTSVVEAIHEELKEAGWRTTADSNGRYLRVTQGTAVLTVFVDVAEERGGEAPTTSATRPDGTTKPKAPPARPPQVYVLYEDRLSHEEQCEAVGRLVADDAPLEVLRVFRAWWTRPMEKQILARLEANSTEPEDWLELAELRHRNQEDQEALAALRKASLLIGLLSDAGHLEGRVKNLAKKLGEEDLPEKPADPDVLRELGFLELKPGDAIPEQELRLGQSARFFAISPQGEVKMIQLRVKSAEAHGGPPYRLEHAESQPGRRRVSVGGLSSSTTIDGTCSAAFRVRPAGDKDRFHLTVEIRDRPDAGQEKTSERHD